MQPSTSSNRSPYTSQILRLRAAPCGGENELLRGVDVAAWLGVTNQFLERSRSAGKGPNPTRLSRNLVRYLKSDVRSFLQTKMVEPSAGRSKFCGIPIPVRLHLDKRSKDLINIAPGKDPDDLFLPTDVSSWWGVSTSWLERARFAGYGPAYIEISSSRIRYRRENLLRFLRGRVSEFIREYETGGAK